MIGEAKLKTEDEVRKMYKAIEEELKMFPYEKSPTMYYKLKGKLDMLEWFLGFE
jgi:tRNA threonylcarbamoyladenosine modification (KEOPS) complex  Pcc1 subunit